MIVVKNNRGRGRGGRLSKHFPGMHEGGVERANRDNPDSDDTVLRVEHHDAELLHRAGAVLRKEVRRELSWCTQPWPLRNASDERATSKLDGRKNLRCSRVAHARDD